MAPSLRAARAPPKARNTRPRGRISYAEPSTDTESDDSDDESVDSSHATNLAPLHRSARQQTVQATRLTRSSLKRPREVISEHPSKTDSSSTKHTKRRRGPVLRESNHGHTEQSLASKLAVQTEFQEAANSSRIPKWQTLPWLVLQQIFRYAASPLYDEVSFTPQPSLRWLLGVAMLCRSFAEPAFNILYSSPPLVPMDKAHLLVDLLSADSGAHYFKYRQKITTLQIDVRQCLAYSLHGRGHLDIHALIRYLPRLANLELYHQYDLRPYRQLDEPIKWNYPEELFNALLYVNRSADGSKGEKTSACKLRSWRWSSRLAGKKWPIHKLKEIHLSPSFIGLTKVAFVNYQFRNIKKAEDDPDDETMLADALSVLKNLEHLVFEASTLVNAKLFPLLPRNLKHLELINCWEVTSELLGEFLLTHGRHLRSLTLNHNQALNLSFLTVLASACPKLEARRMDLQFYDAHISYHDSEPDFEVLIRSNQVPMWPSTLRAIELTNLRKWDREASEMFFQSLIDHAGKLPDLRTLVLQTSIDIGWRDRAAFRGQWIGALTRVFKRVSAPPVSIIRASDVVKPTVNIPSKRQSDISTSTSTSNSTALSESSIRRSARHRAQKTYVESPTTSEDETEAEGAFQVGGSSERVHLQAKRVSRELASLEIRDGVFEWPSSAPGANPPEGSNDLGTRLQAGLGDNSKATETIHGMCEVVNVRIDNLRPTENQLTERDFLDSEPDDDDDWNGDDGFVDNDRLAW